VDYTRKRKANAILRGIRAMSDFENEFQLALMNRRLNRDIQSVFLMTDYKWFYMSSSLIKEVASLGGDIKGMVPKIVAERLIDKFNKLKA
jgi:pantetheine-phosphate adenylyltransferase